MPGYSEKEKLALQIIDLAKAEVLLDNHFLAEAVGRLTVEPVSLESTFCCSTDEHQFATNGESLGYNPQAVIAAFRSSGGAAPKHDLLHSVVHCVFLHPFVGSTIIENLWNLAADIAAERVVAEVLGPREDPRGKIIARTLAYIEEDLGCRATAEKIYSKLKSGRWEQLVPQWELLFASDDHISWYAPPSMDTGFSDSEAEKGKSNDESNVRGPEEAPDSKDRQPGQHTPPEDAEQRDDNTMGENQMPDPHAPQGENEDNQPDESEDEEASDQGEGAKEPGPQEDEEEPLETEETSGSPDRNLSTGDNAHPSGSQTVSQAEHFNDQATAPGMAPSDGSAKLRAQGLGEGQVKESYSSQRQGQGIFTLQEEQRMNTLDRLREEWSRVATNLSVNLQTFQQEKVSAQSGFVADLELAAARPIDYREFLKRFAAMGEVMHVSPDEFDYVYYTYGMSLYGNMPLVEPLEYREEKRIREFVIVIDTSGSVQGDIVRTFVDTTFDVLKSVESFHKKINLRIIQCDAAVQSDDKITSPDELTSWGRSLRLYGGGGTDFRPAFRYVDDLIDAGEFRELGGLIYFTDGWGTYPEWMPSYRTAFVFYDDNYRPENVPPWAIQAVLGEEALERSKRRPA